MKKLALFLALLLMLSVLPATALADEMDYEQTLFDRSRLIEIDIRMDDAAWDNMIATADAEEYSACDLVVNGVLYENVAIRPKGNSSMSSVTKKNSERYSWRIKFDKFEKGRTCDGLDILILNNGFNDPGNVREAISYDMYAYLGADASFWNFAVVYHNGEYFGVYLALEGVDESFCERNYGEDYGELYKPELGGMGANRNNNNNNNNNNDRASGEARERSAASAEPAEGENETASAEPARERTSENASAEPAEGENETASAEPAEDEAASAEPAEGESSRRRRASDEQEGEQRQGASREANQGNQGNQGNRGGFGGSNSGMALNYVGDDLSNYQGIWDESKFKSDDEDHARVVEALKHVCAGEDFEDYLFLDNVLKYFAIQTFIYNRDGLTGTVAHNYYIYEQDGRLNLVPWDMNESFTVSGDGSAYVNFPIDTPFTVSDLSQRSFFMALLGDEECLAQYHEYLRQLSEGYVQGGELAALMAWLETNIYEYYETDPTSFADFSTIQGKAEGLETVIGLRAESVLGQIAGEIPSTRDGQEAEPDKLLDTSGADLSGLTGGGSREMGR